MQLICMYSYLYMLYHFLFISGVSACASCLASDVLLIPYISLDKACRVCRQCRTLLTGSFSPTLISIHMSALADASMNSRQADHRASVVSDEVRQSIYFLQSVTADELRELISPRSECSNLSSRHIDTMSHTSSTDEVNSAKYSDCRVTIPSYRGETVGKELGLELANTLKSSAGVKDKNKASSSTTFLRNIIASISSKSKSKSSRALFSSSSKVNSAVNDENANTSNSCKMSQLEMVALLTSDKWADEIDICNSAGSDVDADIDNVGDDDHSENSYEEDERLLAQVQRSVLDNFTH